MHIFRKDKILQGEAPKDDADVEMTDESEPTSPQGSTSDLHYDPDVQVDPGAVAQAALAISQTAIDAAAGGAEPAATKVIAETARALSEASLEAVSATQEDATEAEICLLLRQMLRALNPL